MKKYLKDKRINNTWAVIKIEDLPENFPVITVREYPSKSLAEFHLEEYCLVPRSLADKVDPIESNLAIDKTEIK